MLLKFGASNFYCFKEGFEISLELNAKCPINISKGKAVSNLLCVKGANASGKTNVLKALSFLNTFCCDSFNLKPEEDIPIDSYFRNNDPINIYCNFIISDTTYHYEVSLTDKMILSEKLSRKNIRMSPVFERVLNEFTYCINDYIDLKSMKLRSNASVISTSYQHEIKSMSDMYAFFSSIISNVRSIGKINLQYNYRSVTEHYKENPDLLDAAIKIIKTFDLGITNIKINEGVQEDGSKYYFPVFEHDANVEDNWLVFYNESLGTQTLYKNLPYFINTLNNGGILVMDEFDTDFHPHMLQLLVSYFDNELINSRNAQFIFSTHNTDILEYLSKYRTVIVNKESSESYAYRLDELPGDILRNDRPIAPVYNSGKIGGVPKL